VTNILIRSQRSLVYFCFHPVFVAIFVAVRNTNSLRLLTVVHSNIVFVMHAGAPSKLLAVSKDLYYHIHIYTSALCLPGTPLLRCNAQDALVLSAKSSYITNSNGVRSHACTNAQLQQQFCAYTSERVCPVVAAVQT
jgi:hypothetical protein